MIKHENNTNMNIKIHNQCIYVLFVKPDGNNKVIIQYSFLWFNLERKEYHIKWYQLII